jgi:mRNA interferase RelE/StbE
VKIEYKESVERDLRRIEKKEARRILRKIEKVLGEDPARGISLKGEYVGLYRLRVGDYRAIYCKTQAGVLILRVGHRKKAYSN